MSDFKDFFAAHEGELLTDLAALVAIPSARGGAAEGAPFGAEPRRALEAARKLGESYGFEARTVGDRVTVIEYGEGEPELGILAHLDVVPASGEWRRTEPFQMAREGDMLYGRGVADDKGPAVAALYALRAVKASGIKLTRKVQLLLGSDEENGSGDVAWYLENEKMPPKVFTPDGDFPVVNTEKGRMQVDIAFSGVSDTLLYLKGGSVVNAVPDLARAVVRGVAAEAIASAIGGAAVPGVTFDIEPTEGGFALTAHGRASHASAPEEGANAVTALTAVLSALPAEDGVFSALRALSAAFPYGDHGGRAYGAYTEDDISGGLTQNLGLIGYEGGALTASVDHRIPVSGSGEDILARLTAELRPAGLSVAAPVLLPPHSVDAGSDFVTGLMDIYREVTGDSGSGPIAMGGLTYVHEIEGGVAFGCTLPGRTPHMHEPDEEMPVSDLLAAGDMFARAIVKFCG